MIKNKETFLKQVALMPELKENKLSLVFAMNPRIDISNKVKFVDNVTAYFLQQKEEDRAKIIIEESKEDALDSWLGKDLRINKVKIKSVRGFPDSSIPFGIDFSDKSGKPQSMIILGSNGSGKSSIYNSIEYAYCKKIGEAQLRTYRDLNEEDDVFKDYLSHFDNSFQDSFCEIDTVTEKLTLQGVNVPQEVRKKINPNTHFISDYDIYSNGRLNFLAGNENSFHNLIAESLGLSELLFFERNLNAFVSYRRATEGTRINALMKANEEESKLIKTNQESLREKSAKLAELTETQKAQPQDNKIKELQAVTAKARAIDFLFKYDYQLLLSSISEFEIKYKQFSALEVKSGALSQVQFLNLGLDLLKNVDNCPFCNDSKKDKMEIVTFVTERLQQIESFNTANHELTRAINFLTEGLENLFNQTKLFKGKVAQELNMIKSYSEFSDLISKENSLNAYLDSAQANDFFLIGNGLSENEKSKLDKNGFLFSYLQNQQEYIDIELKSFIDTLSNFVIQRNEILIAIDQKLATNLQSTTVYDQILLTKAEIATLDRQIEGSNKKIENNDTELKRYREQQAIFSEIKTEARIYTTNFHTLLNREVQQAFSPIKLIVEEVLESYLQRENRDVDIEIKMQAEEIDEETGEILSEIITAYIVPKNKSIPPLPVHKYFNTFHYRLFSTVVGISIAVASRINTKINLPLVLDDIFYASDFENRATIEEFIKELFEVFKKYTPDLELQLILFTHDQLIFESAVKATAVNKIDNIVFSKLFPYKNAKDKVDYKELTYRMPAYLPYTIMQNTLIEA
jgi:energy-coupling factor transporter ATP-binding protein EcfA2